MVSLSVSKDKAQTLHLGFPVSKYAWNTTLWQIVVSQVQSTHCSASNKYYFVLISCAKGRIPTTGNRNDQEGTVMYGRNNKLGRDCEHCCLPSGRKLLSTNHFHLQALEHPRRPSLNGSVTWSLLSIFIHSVQDSSSALSPCALRRFC